MPCAMCKKRAMMLCNSDQAKLCWECDEKVHSANFLVAKHSRVLLCRSCHSLTPWKASGTKLTPSLSLCHRCFADRHDVDDGIDYFYERENHQVMSSSATSPSNGSPSPFKRLRNHSFSVDSHDETASSSCH